MKMMKWALLGGAAFAVMSTSAQADELSALKAQLEALRARLNPHFLFNALTTIGYLIQTAPARALETLMRLTALLRIVLRSEGEFTTLGRELDLIEAYLDIEHARFEQRLRVRIDVPQALRNIRLPPLLLQPIVENAIKHGIAPLRQGGDVTVMAAIDATGAGATAHELKKGRDDGVGLRNIERRLIRQYGSSATLAITTASGSGTTVEIRMPADVTLDEVAIPTRSAS